MRSRPSDPLGLHRVPQAIHCLVFALILGLWFWLLLKTSYAEDVGIGVFSTFIIAAALYLGSRMWFAGGLIAAAYVATCFIIKPDDLPYYLAIGLVGMIIGVIIVVRTLTQFEAEDKARH